MIQSTKKKLAKASVSFFALGIVSCTVEELPELNINSVSIYATPDANQNSAIAIDLVMVYNIELLKTIGKMSAAKYFTSVRQLLIDNPLLLDIWHWELVPGQMVVGFAPPQDKGPAFGAYVFANYLTPGDRRLKVAPDGIVDILLLRDDLVNLALKNSNDWNLGTTLPTMNYARDMGDCDSPVFGTNQNQSIENLPGLSYSQMGPYQGGMPTCQGQDLLPCSRADTCAIPTPPVTVITRPLNPPN